MLPLKDVSGLDPAYLLMPNQLMTSQEPSRPELGSDRAWQIDPIHRYHNCGVDNRP
jgi:hypothetical protein